MHVIRDVVIPTEDLQCCIMKHELVGVDGDTVWFIKGDIVLCTLDEPNRRVWNSRFYFEKVLAKISRPVQVASKVIKSCVSLKKTYHVDDSS